MLEKRFYAITRSRKEHVWYNTAFIYIFATELQKKYENERLARQRAEETLLETEKKKSELSVDLTQLNSMTDTLKADLRMEIEKVWAWWFGVWLSVWGARSELGISRFCWHIDVIRVVFI